MMNEMNESLESLGVATTLLVMMKLEDARG